MTHLSNWKQHIQDLRDLAGPVDLAQHPGPQFLSARQAARCLTGILSLVVRRWNVDVMQRSCAELVRCVPTWGISGEPWRTFGRLPLGADGAPTEPVAMIATAASGPALDLPAAGAPCGAGVVGERGQPIRVVSDRGVK